MNLEEVREYCLTLPRVTEDMPYGPDVLVFRIEGKIFMHLWLGSDIAKIAIKLEPERGEELRDQYSAFTPAFHMNKKHWSDVIVDEGFTNKQVEEWIHESYELVRSKLPKAIRDL